MNEIKFIQFNAGKRLLATTELTANDTIYLLQEPYLYEGKRGAVIHPRDFHCKDKGRAAIYTPNLQSAKFTIMEQYLRKDLVAGILENPKFRTPVVIAAIYMDILQPALHKDWQDLLTYCRSHWLPLLCGVDSNAWSYLWFSRKENKCGTDLENFLPQERALIHNRGSVPTFIDKDVGRNLRRR